MKRHALFVGVNKYDDKTIRDLKFSIPDASVLADRFKGLGYKTRLLPDPTGAELKKAVIEESEELGRGDVFLFFFAGHGFTAQDGSHLLFCRDDIQRLLRRNAAGVKVDALEELTSDHGFHRAFLLDSCRTDCFAGIEGRGSGTTRDLDFVAVPEYTKESGSYFLLRSCDKFRPSLEFDEIGHGLFTQGLLDAMAAHDSRLAICDTSFAEAIRVKMAEIQRAYNVIDPQRPSLGDCSGPVFPLFDSGFLSSTTTILVGAASNVSLRPRVGLPPPVLVPDGMPFGAQVTFAETMWVGVASPVKIAFKADRDIYADVAVSVLNGDEVLYHHSHGSRPFTSEIKFSFNVCPRMPGEPIELTVRFDCNRDGSSDPDVFETMFPVSVHEKQAKNVNINTATVVTDTESDVFQHKVITASGDSIEDKRPFLAQNVTLPLEFSLAATPNRLTLAHEGGVIHIWAIGPDETIICGRDNTCDYMLRVFDTVTGELDENKSFVISGRHFRFVLEGGRTMRVADGMDSPSSWGTSVGEIDVGNDGMILDDGEYGIDIGTKYTRRGVISLDVSVTRNEDDGTLAGFTIARSDGLNERVIIIVNRSVPFEGGAFAWDGKKFLFNGKIIIPGLPINVAGTPCEVRAFHQRKR